METSEPKFVSSRAVEEELRQYKYRAFDKMVDLALDGVITIPEAIKGFQEQLDDEGISA